MIIDDLDIEGTVGTPAEAHAPLGIDPNAELTASITAQGFETVARNAGQIAKRRRPASAGAALPDRETRQISEPASLHKKQGYLCPEMNGSFRYRPVVDAR